MTVDWTDKVWTWDKDHRQNGREWPAGPWDGEPDKVQWVDEATGLDCLIVRGPMGALCGYVGVPPEHPFSGVHYNACATEATCEGDWGDERHDRHVSPERVLTVHGGITFSDFCVESEKGEGHGICHVAEPGRPEKVFWFGFDCAHFSDVVPAMLAEGVMSYTSLYQHGEYRDVHYVKEQVELLATQLKEFGRGPMLDLGWVK